jgi:hypothetical protein
VATIDEEAFFFIAKSSKSSSWRYFPPGIATKILDSVLALELSGLKIEE